MKILRSQSEANYSRKVLDKVCLLVGVPRAGEFKRVNWKVFSSFKKCKCPDAQNTMNKLESPIALYTVNESCEKKMQLYGSCQLNVLSSYIMFPASTKKKKKKRIKDRGNLSAS